MQTLNDVFLNISAAFMKKARLLNPREDIQTCPNCYLVFLLEVVFWIPLLTPTPETQIQRSRPQGVYFLHHSIIILHLPPFQKHLGFDSVQFFCVQLPRWIENTETEGCN